MLGRAGWWARDPGVATSHRENAAIGEVAMQWPLCHLSKRTWILFAYLFVFIFVVSEGEPKSLYMLDTGPYQQLHNIFMLKK